MNREIWSEIATVVELLIEQGQSDDWRWQERHLHSLVIPVRSMQRERESHHCKVQAMERVLTQSLQCRIQCEALDSSVDSFVDVSTMVGRVSYFTEKHKLPQGPQLRNQLLKGRVQVD